MRFLTMILIVFVLGGCSRPFDKPEFQEIGNNETGFLLPLDGNTSEQAKFSSQELLEKQKVATKRVQITHTWVQTGKYEKDGEWMPNVKLIKVDRAPILREWTADIRTGTTSKDESIKVESKDSVNLSIGITCTANISEADAAKFLYWHPSGSLAQIMDTEVRGRIQKAASDEAARYEFEQIKSKKTEIIQAIRSDVIEYFTARGITISSLGLVGGFQFDNPKIQESIDDTVVKQQLKVIANAEWEAQQKKNERMTLEADAKAEMARRIAKGEAEAKVLIAQAEAESIRLVTAALRESQQNPLVFQFKTLEVQRSMVEKWDGKLPHITTGGSGGPSLLLQVDGLEKKP